MGAWVLADGQGAEVTISPELIAIIVALLVSGFLVAELLVMFGLRGLWDKIKRALLVAWHWFSWLCCLPLTIIGSIVFTLGFAYPFRMDSDGVIHWRALKYGIHSAVFGARLAGAYTLGCCVCWPSYVLDGSQISLFQMNHEKRHTAQMRTWMAAAVLLLFATTGIMAGWSLIRTGDVWHANPIELDAISHEYPPDGGS